MKIVTVVGARPQFIKAAPVSRELRSRRGVSEFLLHTGQHFDPEMSDVFFSELGIPEPDTNLGISGGSHASMTGDMLIAVENTLVVQAPDWVLVYGDTNSTLAGALAAAKLQIPVAHVEAGLRSWNRGMPEEINRVLTDHVSDLLLAPTTVAAENLRREGVDGGTVHVVGDVMYDASLYYADAAERQSDILVRHDLRSGEYVLATVHRAENTGVPAHLSCILNALAAVAEKVPVVLPLHPRTNLAIERLGLSRQLAGLRVIPPAGYLDMIMLEKHARLIATDSGGVQKEAFFHRVPCVTLRDETEWTELIDLGWNTLAPPRMADNAVTQILFQSIGRVGSEGAPYGDGNASQLIGDALEACSVNA